MKDDPQFAHTKAALARGVKPTVDSHIFVRLNVAGQSVPIGYVLTAYEQLLDEKEDV